MPKKKIPRFTRAEIELIKERTSLSELYRQITGNPLQTAGANRHKGLCPFHDDTDPSFTIFNDIRFHCFGCGKSGDAFTLLSLVGITDFREAAAFLGGETVDMSRAEVQAEMTRLQRRQQLRAEFEAWVNHVSDILGFMIRTEHRAADAIRDEEALNRYGGIYDHLAVWEYWFHDILINGTNTEKLELKMYFEKQGYGVFDPPEEEDDE